MGYDQYADMRNYYTQQQNEANKMNYGLMLDQYNRDLAKKQNYYGQLRDLVGIGLDAKKSALGQQQHYAGQMGNLALSQGDIKSHALQSMSGSLGTGFDPIGEMIF